MLKVLLWTIIFSIATAISVVLLGSRDLISGNLYDFKKIFHIITNWKFIISMFAALLARISFMVINNSLLKIPKLAEASTTITTFITLFGLILVVIANIIFLKEKINVSQGIGATFIMIGIWIMLK